MRKGRRSGETTVVGHALNHTPEDSSGGPSGDGEPQIEAVLAAHRAGRAEWPGVDLAVDDLLAHVRALGLDLQDLARHGSDLYVACACSRGDRTALRLFERRVIPPIERHLTRIGIAPAYLDEAIQALRVRLFSGDRPRMPTYACRGPLFPWVRIVAVRLALDLVSPKVSQGESMEPEAVDRIMAAGADPELCVTRKMVRDDFQRALDESLAALSPRAKTILRMHYVDGLNIDAIGTVYRVHRATVARWLVGIRATVMAKLRESLSLSLRPTSSDFRSLAAALAGELQISIDRVLPVGGDSSDPDGNDSGNRQP